MDLTHLKKEIDKVVDENKKLAHIKENYIEIATEVNSIAKSMKTLSEKLLSLSIKIDPVRSIKVRSSTNTKLKTTVADLYNKLQSGTDLTIAKVSMLYGELNENQVSYIMRKISTMSNVTKTKDKGKLRLFATKER